MADDNSTMEGAGDDERERQIEAARSGTEALRRYWTHGEGGIKIGWGTPGDFMRCVRRLDKYMTNEQAKGFCAERHHDALGIWPGEH